MGIYESSHRLDVSMYADNNITLSLLLSYLIFCPPMHTKQSHTVASRHVFCAQNSTERLLRPELRSTGRKAKMQLQIVHNDAAVTT